MYRRTNTWMDRLTNKGMDITMDKTMGPVVNVPFVGRDTLHAPEIHFLSRVKRSSMLVSQKGFGIYISIRIYTQWDNTGPPHFVFWVGEKKEKARQISNRERQRINSFGTYISIRIYTQRRSISYSEFPGDPESISNFSQELPDGQTDYIFKDYFYSKLNLFQNKNHHVL